MHQEKSNLLKRIFCLVILLQFSFAAFGAPPIILETHPKDNSTNVPINSGLYIKFDQDITHPVNPLDGGYDVNCTGPGFCLSSSSLGCSAWTFHDEYAFLNYTLEDNKNYNVQITADCFRNSGSEFFAGINNAVTWNFSTGTGTACTWQDPCYTPLDDATGAPVAGALEIEFYTAWDGDVNGRITVFDSPSTFWRQGGVLSSAEISGHETTTFTFDPTPNFNTATSYHVKIDTLYENGGAAFLQFNNATEWNFTTGGSPGVLTDTYPFDEQTFAFSNSDLMLHFSKAMNLLNGNITIRDSSNALIDTIDVNGTNIIGDGEANFYIYSDYVLTQGESYYVEIDSDAFEDIDGNPYSGFTGAGTWDFTVTRIDTSPSYSDVLIDTNFTIDSQYGDFDGDGDIDIAQITGSGLNVWINDGLQNFTSTVPLNPGSLSSTGASSVEVSDIDLDGDLDLSVGASNAGRVVWFENDGSALFNGHEIDASASSVYDVEIADLDGDGDKDIVACTFSPGLILWYRNDGSQAFTRLTVSSSIGTPDDITVGDLDDDGDLDIAVGAPNANAIAWFENDGSEVFTRNNIVTSYSNTREVKIFDLDDDGDKDLISANDGIDELAWWENDGSENFTKRLFPGGTANYNSFDVVDDDGDGDFDVIASTNLTVYRFENNGSEVFSRSSIFTDGTTGRNVKVLDLDLDGFVDILYSYSDFVWLSGAPVTPLLATSFSPPDNGTAIDVDVDLQIEFDQNVDTQTGNLEIRQVANGNLVEAIPIGSVNVTGNGTNILNINPSSSLPFLTDLYVTIDATAIDSVNGDDFAGISANTEWNFQTQSLPDWYGCAWQRRLKLQVQASQVNGDQVDFPVYVNMNDLLATGIFANVDENGDDLRVTEADGITELPIEVVDIDTGANAGEIHFRADNLSGSQNTTFFLYYDNPGAEAYDNGDTYGSDNVWTNNYRAVYHMQEDPSSSNIFDSTSNDIDLTANGSFVSGDSVTGKLGQSISFDGANQALESTITSNLTNFTVEAFLNLNDNSQQNFMNRISGSTFYYGSSRLRIFQSGDRIVGTSALSTGTWHHVAASSNGSVLRVYKNSIGENASSYSLATSADIFQIGSPNPSFPYSPNGEVDEIRVSSVERASDWLQTSYNNQNSPSSFYTAQTETIYPLSLARVLHFSPPNNAYMVNRQQGLTIIFDRNMQKGTGNIRIRRFSDDVVLRTIDVTGSEVSVVNNVATIKDYGTLNANNQERLYIEADPGAFEDSGSGLDFECIDTKDKWNFNSVKHANTGF